MKTTLKFMQEFRIPKILPHAGPRPDECEEEWSNFCYDYVAAGPEGSLELTSNCGTTTFPNGTWSEGDDAFTISAETTAHYDGAYAAINAVWGIDFPECGIGAVESTYGNFPSVEEYEAARLFHQMMNQLKGWFFKNSTWSNDGRSGEQILRDAKIFSQGAYALHTLAWQIGRDAIGGGAQISPEPLMETLLQLGEAVKKTAGHLLGPDEKAFQDLVATIFGGTEESEDEVA